MTREEKELALYCLKASSDYHSEVCEECIKYPNCDHTRKDDVTETIIKALEKEPKTEKVIKMRDTTPEERELIDKYIKSISKPIGVDFWDLEQEPKIIETLDFAIDASNGDTNYFVGFRNGLRYSKSLIDGEEPQFENCTEQEPKAGWIPVSERLPEMYTYTLWCASSGYVRSDYFNGEFWEDAKKYCYEVIAWMPLPKSYKAESEEQA